MQVSSFAGSALPGFGGQQRSAKTVGKPLYFAKREKVAHSVIRPNRLLYLGMASIATLLGLGLPANADGQTSSNPSTMREEPIIQGNEEVIRSYRTARNILFATILESSLQKQPKLMGLVDALLKDENLDQRDKESLARQVRRFEEKALELEQARITPDSVRSGPVEGPVPAPPEDAHNILNSYAFHLNEFTRFAKYLTEDLEAISGSSQAVSDALLALETVTAEWQPRYFQAERTFKAAQRKFFEKVYPEDSP